ncbi:MAG: adenylosuccinate synthase [Candidatus Levybacteria bacterium RIFCSPHIGHO2_01_FULL_37_17]|nr:MAG: adenylosuccinate synthase [Candidatus Levybacteria bacterium RIFCSPHIGHO2_01_FULL_37_17]OGH36415.1 MAG: adenylosuccinate synthase [Candidatus Levybacteria bacterium RIFCSPLOWO2_01_FULL_38_23]
MGATVIIGAQWGDEGKGKIIDHLSSKVHLVARFHGGNNAGHTVVNKYGKFAMHLIPSGIFNKKSISLIGPGVVLDLEVLVSEIQMLEKAGLKLDNRLFISPRCNIILPYHKILEKIYEEAKGKNKTWTTGRGISPTYADKVTYNGIRVFDFLDKKILEDKFQTQLFIKNKIIKAFGEKELDLNEILKIQLKLFKKIEKYVKEPFAIVNKALDSKEEILLEGAHGVFLDNDWGTYPFVTASSILSGNAVAGLGIAPQKINKIIGVAKAYITRVGFGPFPTELTGKDGADLRNLGNEFGSTTGRPRRCGWFDAEMAKFAAKINGFTDLAITKMDILDSFKEIKVCTHYLLNGSKIRYFDLSTETLSKLKPVYKTLPGWRAKTNGIKKYKDLPKNAKSYLREIEKLVGVKISYISTGAETENIVEI